ncbi:hypothetical protein N0V83_009402 [Neocucurbitaria cava]|uniref:Uncharacterized protein n=1 Tax=Neocucurbitaria cava TaxID=798079 RepID=A0A9W9CIE1_9PLEO|nr:hypothetical protein N0V83_009402 [Neocucurbitaria cava]
MAKAAAETPYREVDPLMPWFAHLCHAWPRAKQNPGDWADESSTYAWDLSLAASKRDTHACHPSQRIRTYYLTPTDPKLPHQTAPAPMATASAGSNIKLLFGGNGHSRGDNVGGHGDPGQVIVYWKGEAGAEIVDVSEFRDEFKVQENGFAEESFAWPPDKSVTKPPDLRDKGNWMTLKM